MSKKSFIEVTSPCEQDWDEMRGSDRVRFCEHCAKEVNNISTMTRKEAMRMVRKSEGRICVRYVKNPKTNVPVFTDRLYQISRRSSTLAAGVMTASLSLSTLSYAQGDARIVEPLPSIHRVNQPQYLDDRPEREKDVEIRTDSETAARISGTITDPNGAVIPNVSLTLTNDQTKETSTTVSDEEGYYEFEDIVSGIYELLVESTGFKKYLLTNIEITVDRGLKQDIMMDIGDIEVSVGGIGVVEYASSLHQAVANNDLEEVRNLIIHGENVNAKALVSG